MMLTTGLAPSGVGIYQRDRYETYRRWDFVAINAWRADRARQVETARASGARVFLYGTPEHFNPTTWRTGVKRLRDEARALHADGIIADPETGWKDLPSGERNREARALGALLREAAINDGLSVGFTSYPLWSALPALVAGADGAVWGSPQIYGRTSQNEATFDSWWARWVNLLGETRVILSFAAWDSNTALSTAEGYRSYLAKLPQARGAIGWDETGNAPSYIRDGVNSYSPGTVATDLAVLTHPPIIAAIAIGVVAVLAVAIFARKAAA